MALFNGKAAPRNFSVFKLFKFSISEYELSHTGPVIVQFFHRLFVYSILFILILLIYNYYSRFASKLYLIIFLVLVQILLGILTLLNSHGSVPLWYGSLHQLTGIILLLSCIDFLSIVSKFLELIEISQIAFLLLELGYFVGKA